jgi:hypothetical protein
VPIRCPIEFRVDSLAATPFLTLTPAGGGCSQWYQSSLRLGLASVQLGTHAFYISAKAASTASR